MTVLATAPDQLTRGCDYQAAVCHWGVGQFEFYRGASEDELVEAFPTELAKLVGYYGPASGAAAAFRRLAEGLDTAIVRVVASRPEVESITAVMEACQPTASLS